MQLLTQTQAVLRVQHEVRRAAEHADLPGLHRHARHAAGDEPPRPFELALQTAVALNCQIAPFTKWDRKQYYYPDLPKGYQISQYDLPFSHDGYLEISDPKGRFETKQIGIIRAHLEEDAGKSMHDEVAGAGRQPHRPEPRRHAAVGNRQPARHAFAARGQGLSCRS